MKIEDLLRLSMGLIRSTGNVLTGDGEIEGDGRIISSYGGSRSVHELVAEDSPQGRA
jgi:hypothetical protein